MRVAFKFALAMVLLLMVIRLIEGALTVQRETERLDANIRRDARLMGRILKNSLRTAWEANGRAQAMELLNTFNLEDHPVQISWAPFEGEDGLSRWIDAEALATLRRGDSTTVRQRVRDHGEMQYHFVPLDISGADGVIQQAVTLEQRSRYLRNALIRETIASALVFLVGGGAMLALGVVAIGRPLSRLRERIGRIGEGQLSERIEMRGRDELSTLASGLNAMCANLAASREREAAETEKRLQAMEQMRHMDRLTTIGRLASGVAHELGTPLNVIAGRAGMLANAASAPDNERVHKLAATIKAQADRMTTIIRHLLDFARQRPPQRVETQAVSMARQAAELVSCLGYQAKARIETKADTERLVAPMDPVQMQQVMTNLIENALQAMPDGGDAIITIDAVAATPPAGIPCASRYLRIAIQDSGRGIAPEDLPNVFDPFFTTKDVGKGTGLGLSISHGIVREHGGWIDVTSQVGKGSRFTIHIPHQGEPSPCADAS